MSLTYTTWLSEVATLASTNINNVNFLIEVPNAIDYAEQRMFRDLDLVTTISRDSSQSTVASNRNVTVPGAFIVLNAVNIITPAGVAPDSGKRNPLTRTSEAFLDFCFPDNSIVGVPTLYDIIGGPNVANPYALLLGAWPDNAYKVEMVGTQRPAALSNSNQTTYLSTFLPDMFLVATMIHIAGYQKNFGAQADDPRSAVSWEMQYKTLLESANKEELRKRYQGTVMQPPPGMSAPPPAARMAAS
jgi:hypothetical protein